MTRSLAGFTLNNGSNCSLFTFFQINKVREAIGNESDQNIVEYCINDEEWLNVVSQHSSHHWKLSVPYNTTFSTQSTDLQCC